MNRTHLDSLFQATLPIVERTGFSLPRADEQGPGFGDHLSQASSTTQGDPSTVVRTNDQPTTKDTLSNDLETTSAESSRSEMSLTASSSPGDRHDCDSEESRGIEKDRIAETTPREGSSGPVSAEEGDSKRKEEEKDELQDTVSTAIEAGGSQPVEIIAASAELVAPEAFNEATAKLRTLDNAAKADQSDRGATPEQLTTETVKVDASSVNVAVSTSDALNQPAAPIKLVEDISAAQSTKKPHTANPTTTVKRKSPAQREAQVEDHIGVPQQDSDVAALPEAATSAKEVTSIELALKDPASSEREPSSEKNRDADVPSPPRQRSDATAIANNIPTAAVANGVVTPLENNSSPKDAAEGAAQPAKSVAAKVDGLGNAANRLHANASSAKRGGRTDATEETPRIDPARFVGRVAKAFHTAQERGGTLQIRLNPPELGAMRLELTVKDGVMAATLETETASARRILLEHLPVLRDRLAEQNIRVERFDVEVRRESTGGQDDPRATQDQHQPQQGHSEHRRRQAAQPPITEAARQIKPITHGRTSNNGINLVA